MKKRELPKIDWRLVGNTSDPRLKRWLREWELVQKIAPEVPEAPPPAVPTLRLAGFSETQVAPFDRTEPARGEIRLLSSRLLPAAKRPVYVLVLGDWDDSLKLVAPFGPMLEPATRGELRTRREEFSLSVLCLWNVHTVPVARLQWGWVVDHMHEEEIQEAWSVFRHAATGSPMDPHLEGRVGVPILNADDPRSSYQDGEFQLMSPLSEGILTSAERGRIVRFPSFAGELHRQATAIAASSESRRRVVERFYCADLDLFIDLFMNSNSRRSVLFVRDKKGAPSLGLANTEVVDFSGVPLAKVTGAFASLSVLDAIPGIALRDCAGDVLQLEPAASSEAASVPDSFVWLLERACDAEALALFSDSQLVRLFSYEHLPPDIQASLSGEILLRQWLYRGEVSPVLDENLCRRLSPALREALTERKGSDGLKEIESNTFHEESLERLAWNVFSRRAVRFLRADGLIPVLVGSGEAVPIPFRFEPGLLPDCKVIDLSGHAVENWLPVVRRLEAGLGEALGLVLDVDMGDDIGRIQGESLALPVLIAKSRALGGLPDFQPLRLIASGVERSGALYPAEGHQAKAALANRMGAQFITVGSAESEIPSGIAVRDMHRAVLARINEKVPLNLTPRQLRDAIRLIGDEMKSGQITLETAERRLTWHQKALDPQSHRGLVSEARLLALTLQGAICNHKGETEKAAFLNDSARKEALERKSPGAYVDATAHQVVSLTDLGFLPEAEAMGRGLLSWVRDEMQGGDEDKKRAEMTAAGVLGGQVLLQAALAGKVCGDESLTHLKSALQLAREIENGREICFDAVQLAGWHALLQPARTEEAFHVAIAELEAFPKSINAVSFAYLLRIRFLGAYRNWLKTGSVPEGYDAWELPTHKVAHLSWVLATTFKYRGALFAADGRCVEAAEDFRRAVSLLGRQAPPVLRFIGATAALQAFLSLRTHSVSVALQFLKTARDTFGEFSGTAAPALNGKKWVDLCEHALNGSVAGGIKEVQLAYAY